MVNAGYVLWYNASLVTSYCMQWIDDIDVCYGRSSLVWRRRFHAPLQAIVRERVL